MDDNRVQRIISLLRVRIAWIAWILDCLDCGLLAEALQRLGRSLAEACRCSEFCSTHGPDPGTSFLLCSSPIQNFSLGGW